MQILKSSGLAIVTTQKPTRSVVIATAKASTTSIREDDEVMMRLRTQTIVSQRLPEVCPANIHATWVGDTRTIVGHKTHIEVEIINYALGAKEKLEVVRVYLVCSGCGDEEQIPWRS